MRGQITDRDWVWMDFNERRRLVARRFDERRAVILEGAFVGNGLFAAMVCRYDQRPNILRFEMRHRDACDHSNRAAHRSLTAKLPERFSFSRRDGAKRRDALGSI
jgi:hypothetical protein